jgi:hypothetical protein
VHLHGTELKMLAAIGSTGTDSWPHSSAWQRRLVAAARRANRLVVISPSDRVLAIDLLGVEPESIEVMPNGVDLGLFSIDPMPPETRLDRWRRWLVEDPRGWDESGVAGTVRFLKNIAGLWLIQECQRQWDIDGQEHSFSELAEMAAAAEPFTAFIDPDDAVFASPGNMPSKIRDYCEKTGQAVPDSIGQILRVATESLALKYRFVYENIVNLTGLDFTRLHAGGGGIQNGMLCQATANALGIEVIAGPVEATSCGNIITQMIATGETTDFTSGRALIRDSFGFITYSPEDLESWESAYRDFLRIIS